MLKPAICRGGVRPAWPDVMAVNGTPSMQTADMTDARQTRCEHGGGAINSSRFCLTCARAPDLNLLRQWLHQPGKLECHALRRLHVPVRRVAPDAPARVVAERVDDDRKLLCAAMCNTETEMFRVFTHGERAVPGEKPQAAARTGGLAGHAGSSRPSAEIGYQD
jgi:hypothetical protein